MKNCLHANRISYFLMLSCILALILNQTAYGGEWTAAADMSTARSGHTATLLGDGRVLVAGGSNASIPPYNVPTLSSAEFYIPSTNTWSPAPSMSTPRDNHSATLLKDGRVLVAGGYPDESGGGCLNTAEIYDPLANSWSMAASMVEPHCFHTATLLQDGRVLVGNFIDIFSSTEVYDPSTNAWEQVSDLVRPHSATLLQDGRVLAVEGIDMFSSGPLAYLFNPSTNTWSAAASMASPRSGFSATLLSDGRVLVTGGYFEEYYPPGLVFPAPEIYDPSTNTWSMANILKVDRVRHGATLLHDGSVLVFGGWNSSGWHASAEQYNPTQDFWRVMKNMIAVRANFTATLLPDGRVLVTGGSNTSDGFLSSAELYDPSPTAEPFPWLLFLPPIFSTSGP